MEMYHNQKGLSTERIEFFSDAVFAVAITLLILDVKVPELAVGQTLWQGLWLIWPKLLSYAVSFSVIGIFWAGHHIMFHYIKRADRVLLWLNTLLLMFISAIPFAAALIGEYRNEPVAVALYAVLQTLSGLMFWFIWIYASRKRRLIRPDMPAHLVRLGHAAVLTAPIIYTIAVALAFVNPLISKIIYIAVPLLYLIPSPIDKLVDYAYE